MRSLLLNVALATALCSLGLQGCDGGKEELIAKGRRAAKNENYKEALAFFDEALKADAEDYNALWGKADTYRRDGNLPEQQKVLEQIMGIKELAEKYAAVVKPALETNYRKQADVVMGSQPDKAEGFLRKALELDSKSEANQTLADLLARSGDELLRKAQFAEAKAAYDKAMALRISRKQRSELSGKAEIATFMTYKQSFMPRFEPLKAELVQAGAYDEKEQLFYVEAAAEADGKPEDEGYEQNAERDALVAVTYALYDLTWKVAGKERPENATVPYSADVVTVVAKGLVPPADKKQPATYRFRIAVPLDAVIEQVQNVDAGKFEVKLPEPEAPAAEGAGGAGGAAPTEDGAEQANQ